MAPKPKDDAAAENLGGMEPGSSNARAVRRPKGVDPAQAGTGAAARPAQPAADEPNDDEPNGDDEAATARGSGAEDVTSQAGARGKRAARSGRARKVARGGIARGGKKRR